MLVYYSYTGNTKLIVDFIKKKIKCDVIELKPTVSFSKNYQTVVDEYQNNEIDKKVVEIEDINLNLLKYDNVILGTPVWWYTITPVLRMFLKQYDLHNKNIYAFATNAGWLGNTFKEIENLCNGNVISSLNIKFSEDYNEHKCLTSFMEIENWLDKINEREEI